MSIYLDLLSHFLPFKIHLTNISPILIKMVDFKNLAWATSFATRASRKFIYRASGEKSYCHTLYCSSSLELLITDHSHSVIHQPSGLGQTIQVLHAQVHKHKSDKEMRVKKCDILCWDLCPAVHTVPQWGSCVHPSPAPA